MRAGFNPNDKSTMSSTTGFDGLKASADIFGLKFLNS